ncbi:MAG: hypothetical protein K2K25_06440 [Muribaculaceae bacterium]|nr:hypothetical protein [Muribaculaceae bacterium]
METWFVILLSVIAILAIALLLFLELMGDDSAGLRQKKHSRGKYINDQTAVICQTIKDTDDSRKAYNVFIEYLFTNHRQYLEYLKNCLSEICVAYNEGSIDKLQKCVLDTKEMKVELKDQKGAQDDCISSIESVRYIEALSWIYLANTSRFIINDGLLHLSEVCIDYTKNFVEPFPDLYNEQLETLVEDIVNICNVAVPLIGTPDIHGMRELRQNMAVILSESYSNSQRLYEHLHDGRTVLDPDKRIALQYSLNAFQICHGIIYNLRRFMLANICLTLSLQNNNKGQ